MYENDNEQKNGKEQEEAKMRKDFGSNPLIFPEPVLMIGSYDADGNVDVMNAAWGGVSGNDEITMCLSPGHKSVKNILEKKELTISFADADHVTECDYLGIVSANDTPDKFEKSGLHAVKSDKVDAPFVEELPVHLDCRLKSYDPDTHYMRVEIVNVAADEKVLGEDGNIDLAKLRPITYDGLNHNYNVIGEVVGKAFSIGAKLK